MNGSLLILFVVGVIAGILGGMGFGGGMVLIPLLTLVLNLPPILAAWINLAVFLPSAAVALTCHLRNGLIVWRSVLFFLIFGLVGVMLMFFIKNHIAESWVKIGFGCFLIAVGAISLLSVFVGYIKKKRDY